MQIEDTRINKLPSSTKWTVFSDRRKNWVRHSALCKLIGLDVLSPPLMIYIIFGSTTTVQGNDRRSRSFFSLIHLISDT